MRSSNGFEFRHSGKPGQARNFPYRPSLITISRPHFSQISPERLVLDPTFSIVFSAVESVVGERAVELLQGWNPLATRRLRFHRVRPPSGR